MCGVSRDPACMLAILCGGLSTNQGVNMQWKRTWVAVGSLALWFSGGACSESDGARCGAGTELIAGECLPVSDAGASDAGDDTDAGEAAIATACGDRAFLVDGECRGVEPVGGRGERGEQGDT